VSDRVVAIPGQPGGDNVLRGIFYLLIAVTLFPFMNAAVKLLRPDFEPGMIVWARYAGHFLLTLLMFAPGMGLALFRSENVAAQIFRSVLLLVSTVCYFTALAYIPLATAAVISFTSPFIVTALSGPLLGEHVGWRRWAAVACGFVGAIIVIRPGTAAVHPLGLLVLITASSYGLYQVMTRRISGTDDAATTIAYTALVGAVLSTLVLPWLWQTPQNARQLVLLASLGVIGGLGHYFVVLAFRCAQASVLAPLVYAQIVGATVMGWFLFGDFPDPVTWLGSGVIVGCGIYIAYREGVRRSH